jgi:hypothetical protein
MASWYKVIDGETPLEQGDIVPGCELLCPVPVELESADYDEISGVKVEFVEADIVVMTQSCDLENGNVNNVVVCPIVSMVKFALAEFGGKLKDEALRRGMSFAGVDFAKMDEGTEQALAEVIYESRSLISNFENIAKGRQSGLLLLPPHVGQPKMLHSVVSFRHVYVQPTVVLEKHTHRLGDRLRLIHPYREHLAQSFANYFMRVGLTIPAMSRG